jgi:hypothetical protein
MSSTAKKYDIYSVINVRIVVERAPGWCDRGPTRASQRYAFSSNRVGFCKTFSDWNIYSGIAPRTLLDFDPLLGVSPRGRCHGNAECEVINWRQSPSTYFFLMLGRMTSRLLPDCTPIFACTVSVSGGIGSPCRAAACASLRRSGMRLIMPSGSYW